MVLLSVMEWNLWILDHSINRYKSGIIMKWSLLIFNLANLGKTTLRIVMAFFVLYRCGLRFCFYYSYMLKDE